MSAKLLLLLSLAVYVQTNQKCNKKGARAFLWRDNWYQVRDCELTYKQAVDDCKENMVDDKGRSFPNDRDCGVLWVNGADEREFIAQLISDLYGRNSEHHFWLGLVRDRNCFLRGKREINETDSKMNNGTDTTKRQAPFAPQILNSTELASRSRNIGGRRRPPFTGPPPFLPPPVVQPEIILVDPGRPFNPENTGGSRRPGGNRPGRPFDPDNFVKPPTSVFQPFDRDCRPCGCFNWISRLAGRCCYWAVADGQPNQTYRPDENCAQLVNKKEVADTECDTLKRFICKRPHRGSPGDPGFGFELGGGNRPPRNSEGNTTISSEINTTISSNSTTEESHV